MTVLRALALVAVFVSAQGCSRPVDPKFKEISGLPVGLAVTHSPSKAKAQPGGPSGAQYTWVYTTSVRSLQGTVRITEFGAFVRHDKRWVFSTYTGRPFTPKDFEDWYSCPAARVTPGQTFTDPNNWSGSHQLRPSRTLWYFVGVDQSGARVQGTAELQELPEIVE
jgi:hypothetical protein